MYSGNLDIKLRPLKFAFICHYKDKKSLKMAIEANSALWGGIYNPIIPFFDKTPHSWVKNDILFKYKSKDEYLYGILHNFDPDFIIPLGRYANEDFSKYNIKVLKYEDLITKDKVNYGVSVFELVSYFYDNELKFVRKDPIEMISPKFDKSKNIFLASVFGQIPKLYQEYYKKWGVLLDAEEASISIDNFPEYLNPKKFYVRKLGSLYIDTYLKDFHERTNIFYMDAESSLDIMDYWNLRALGRSVFPVPKQVDIEGETFKKKINDQIQAGQRKYHYNPNIEYRTYIIKSRTTNSSSFEEFTKKINGLNSVNSNSIVKSSYPNIWEILRRNGLDYSAPNLEVSQKSIAISGDDLNIKSTNLKPDFSELIDHDGNPKYANEIKLSFYGNDEPLPDVLPYTNFADQPLRKLGTLGINDARLSSEGLVLLEHNLSDNIYIKIPQAADLFFSYLSVFEIEAQKTKTGRITYKMLSNTGGVRYLDTFTEKELLVLISKTVSSGGHIPAKRLRDKLKEIKNKNKSVMSVSVENTIQTLIKAKALELGLEIECPICTRSSWYSTYTLTKKLECPKCLSQIDFPTFEPDNDTKWSYKFTGPFSIDKYAHGSYSVLLTLRFFNDTLNLKTTPAFNFAIIKGKQEDYEIDLGFITKDKFTRAKEVIPIFCECKSFGSQPKYGLNAKDINNTLKVCGRFPYSIAVFSILRDEFTSKEKRLISAKVISNYKRRAKRKPYADIILLTGTELLSTDRLEEIWSNSTQNHKTYSKRANWHTLEELAEITCKIHLNTDFYYEWYEKAHKQKKSKP